MMHHLMAAFHGMAARAFWDQATRYGVPEEAAALRAEILTFHDDLQADLCKTVKKHI